MRPPTRCVMTPGHEVLGSPVDARRMARIRSDPAIPRLGSHGASCAARAR
jgi:hypothetical protein